MNEVTEDRKVKLQHTLLWHPTPSQSKFFNERLGFRGTFSTLQLAELALMQWSMSGAAQTCCLSVFVSGLFRTYWTVAPVHRSTTEQKGCWQESKSTRIPVVSSSYLTSRATISPAQRGLHSARHGTVGPAVEARCSLTPEEIGSLVTVDSWQWDNVLVGEW